MFSQNILPFLTELKSNHNREWFLDQKQRFQEIQNELVDFTGRLLAEIEKLCGYQKAK
ncbi:DUF2461 family protein [Leptospira ognonensis]|uniref:DUF2461 family protein n=1 Tax=Leptospira ognonensis TaxID=2484945 RepID=A0A4R9K422_9LEPT|nr:DUF2461 family protein [Leptospira ognonensis]TGL59700.1 DUF2461 family protein [Leptospira ognonensis]